LISVLVTTPQLVRKQPRDKFRPASSLLSRVSVNNHTVLTPEASASADFLLSKLKEELTGLTVSFEQLKKGKGPTRLR
jgi:hypothetical protein